MLVLFFGAAYSMREEGNAELRPVTSAFIQCNLYFLPVLKYRNYIGNIFACIITVRFMIHVHYRWRESLKPGTRNSNNLNPIIKQVGFFKKNPTERSAAS